LFNLITGSNGAGKTSLLEAIHLLSVGHSFRTRKTRELLNHKASELSVIAKLHDPHLKNDHRAGIQKNRQGETQLKLNFEALNSMAEMTRILQFLDWGLFHVEQSFFKYWKTYKQALEQRNHALRQQLPTPEIRAWDAELAEAGEAISSARIHYIDEFRAWLVEYTKKFCLDGDITIEYRKGWNADISLMEAHKVSLYAFRSACHVRRKSKSTRCCALRRSASRARSGTSIASSILFGGNEVADIY